MSTQTEQMRRAVEKIRERADAATPGPWTGYGDVLVWGSEKGPAANDPILATIGEAHDDSAEHIASWDPVVARSVAELLEAAANEFDRREAKYGESWFNAANPTADAMVNLARTYLGEES